MSVISRLYLISKTRSEIVVTRYYIELFHANGVFLKTREAVCRSDDEARRVAVLMANPGQLIEIWTDGGHVDHKSGSETKLIV